ncbi:hypothetical protein CLAFUW4_10835 [Fulvia fulva]|uniref:Uncharacterized protein n=1 Tax=Passalora fulva TaxID=5499 RepID=A0A1P8YXV4_PASFU|nr:uncharacterized protein CLAFUR5_09878 [Fulvia fulva]AQA29348.1 hypothetical protein 55 [Fulvia fulva]KAK4619360.1 hypothetical protein CLAFUR4_10840 [Fulvia fulva]KAK4620798.1 hypothetical protein CLAFUR0_10847 [Fulvia fulva]UJO20286.1 hypothetical protein CLAFUR5_09878 [Fulvia fulva]WPV17368.1 hypothetical protein CLAFUW4_10835 [Fulvia fulva]
MFSVSSTLGLAVWLASIIGTEAQCRNTVSVYNPNIRTMSTNSTWFIVPVPKAAVQSAVKAAFPLQALTLLDVPSDPTLFPNGFPAGQHPVMVSIGLTDDIRMSVLQIDGPLLNSNIYATYVSQNGNPAPLAAGLNSYIAGPDGPLPNGLVPAVASTLLFAGNPLRLGQFAPEAAAYQDQGAGNLFAQAKWALIPNPISGPGVYPEAADFAFTTASTSRYTQKTFKELANQPIILPSGQCQRNAAYFTNVTAMPVFRNGDVTLGPGADGLGVTSGTLMQASPDKSGVYSNQDGFSACAQVVGNNPEACDAASANRDPNTLA